MFDRTHRIELDDGRTVVVMYDSERYGWHADLVGEGGPPKPAPTPLEAIAKRLDVRPQDLPTSIQRLSDHLEQQLRDATRYVCACCGCHTLLNPGHYDICDVCGWEDDPYETQPPRGNPDAISGPNRISLNEARANYKRFGASTERRRERVRAPRPEEQP